jgi:hypothetical protein
MMRLNEFFRNRLIIADVMDFHDVGFISVQCQGIQRFHVLDGAGNFVAESCKLSAGNYFGRKSAATKRVCKNSVWVTFFIWESAKLEPLKKLRKGMPSRSGNHF